MRALVATSRWWRRRCGAARGASDPGVLVAYLGAALRVVERSIEGRPDLPLLTMRNLASRRAFWRIEGQGCIGWAAVSEEVSEPGMRQSPGGLRDRGYHDDVMIYRGGSSVPRVRVDVHAR